MIDTRVKSVGIGFARNLVSRVILSREKYYDFAFIQVDVKTAINISTRAQQVRSHGNSFYPV